jgi:hypothetical protein
MGYRGDSLFAAELLDNVMERREFVCRGAISLGNGMETR